LYNNMKKDSITYIQSSNMVADNALVKLLRLRQLTGGIVTDEFGEIYHVFNGKRELLEEVIIELGKHQIVIFYNFIHELSDIQVVAYYLGLQVATLKDLNDWRNGNYRILAVQFQAGSEGISLIEAQHVIYYSKPLSLGLYNQSIRRVSRPGQDSKGTVFFIHLVVRDTVDEEIEEAIEKKRTIIDYLLDIYKTRK